MPVSGTPVDPAHLPLGCVIADPQQPAPNVVASEQHPMQPGCCDGLALRKPVLTPQDCQGQQILVPATPSLNGRPLLTRTKTFTMTARQAATLEHVMQDKTGNPVSLYECLEVAPGVPSDLRLRFRLSEYLDSKGFEYPVEVVNASAGCVRVALSADDTANPGVYFGEFAIVGEDERGNPSIVFSNVVYVVINRGLWAGARSGTSQFGPPSMAEIRLHLRDTSPDESFLLDDVAFSDDEIALAIVRPVEYWNEIPPPVGTYTTANFPYRYHWLEAICAQLFFMCEERHRRNQLTYTAAGLHIDDYNKELNYQRAGQMRQQTWLDFVRREKYRRNAEACFGIATSIYSGYLPYA